MSEGYGYIENLKTRESYRLVSMFYGDRKAERSQEPLIRHIKMGLEILHKLKAPTPVIDAYCLHPLFQDYSDFESNKKMLRLFDKDVILLVCEYRRAANAYLCKPHTDSWTEEDLPLYVGDMLPETRLMLIADKVQNYHDFLKHHALTHARSQELNKYFMTWLKFLKIPTEFYLQYGLTLYGVQYGFGSNGNDLG
jgi:(p)ppGpp synthase/HD superfamily hydrolase